MMDEETREGGKRKENDDDWMSRLALIKSKPATFNLLRLSE
jgi:hypothetical protein